MPKRNDFLCIALVNLYNFLITSKTSSTFDVCPMDSDSDFDGVDHDELLKEIRDIGKPSKKRNLPTVKRAEAQEVDVTDLVGSIKSTR